MKFQVTINLYIRLDRINESLLMIRVVDTIILLNGRDNTIISILDLSVNNS